MLIDAKFCNLKDGEVYIDLRELTGRLFKISYHEAICKCYEFKGNTWYESSIIFLQVISSHYLTNEQHALYSLNEHIPQTWLKPLESISEYQLDCLKFCHEIPFADDLLNSNTFLFFCVVAESVKVDLTDEQIQKIFAQKQLIILGRYVENSDKAFLKFIKKIKLTSYSVKTVKMILELSTPELVHSLRHCQCVNGHNFNSTMAFNKPFFKHYKIHEQYFNQQFAREGELNLYLPYSKSTIQKESKSMNMKFESVKTARDYLNKYTYLYKDVSRLKAALNISSMDAFFNCSSLTEIHQLHDRWSERLNRRNQAILKGDKLMGKQIIFPDSPTNLDSFFIKYVNSSFDLMREGILQEHCVASYAYRCTHGKSFIYKVLFPQRGTLELVWNYNNKLRVHQFKLKRNQKPLPITEKLVKDLVFQYTLKQNHQLSVFRFWLFELKYFFMGLPVFLSNYLKK